MELDLPRWFWNIDPGSLDSFYMTYPIAGAADHGRPFQHVFWMGLYHPKMGSLLLVSCAPPKAFAHKQIFILHVKAAQIQKQKFFKSSLQDDNDPLVETLGTMGKGWLQRRRWEPGFTAR